MMLFQLLTIIHHRLTIDIPSHGCCLWHIYIYMTSAQVMLRRFPRRQAITNADYVKRKKESVPWSRDEPMIQNRP